MRARSLLSVSFNSSSPSISSGARSRLQPVADYCGRAMPSTADAGQRRGASILVSPLLAQRLYRPGLILEMVIPVEVAPARLDQGLAALRSFLDGMGEPAADTQDRNATIARANHLLSHLRRRFCAALLRATHQGASSAFRFGPTDAWRIAASSVSRMPWSDRVKVIVARTC